MLRYRIAPLAAALSCSCWIVFSSVGQAQTSDSDIIQVDEIWELRIDFPDPDSAGPQVACLMAPFGDAEDNLFGLLEFNHRTMWSFRPGGVQLQLWKGAYLSKLSELDAEEVLNTPNEKIRWTIRSSIVDGQLVMEVISGESETWGDFGNAALKVEIATTHSNLNAYSVEQSLKSSGVVYGGNRVAELKIVEVRRTAASGVVTVEQESHILHPQP